MPVLFTWMCVVFFITREMFESSCFLKLYKMEYRTGSFHIHWAFQFETYVFTAGNTFLLYTVFYPLFSLFLSLSGISVNWVLKFFVWSSAFWFTTGFPYSLMVPFFGSIFLDVLEDASEISFFCFLYCMSYVAFSWFRLFLFGWFLLFCCWDLIIYFPVAVLLFFFLSSVWWPEILCWYFTMIELD